MADGSWCWLLVGGAHYAGCRWLRGHALPLRARVPSASTNARSASGPSHQRRSHPAAARAQRSRARAITCTRNTACALPGNSLQRRLAELPVGTCACVHVRVLLCNTWCTTTCTAMPCLGTACRGAWLSFRWGPEVTRLGSCGEQMFVQPAVSAAVEEEGRQYSHVRLY